MNSHGMAGMVSFYFLFPALKTSDDAPCQIYPDL